MNANAQPNTTNNPAHSKAAQESQKPKYTTTASQEKREREQAEQAQASPKFLPNMDHRYYPLNEDACINDFSDAVERQVDLTVSPLLAMKANLSGDRDLMLDDDTFCYLVTNASLGVEDIQTTLEEFIRVTEHKSEFLNIVNKSTLNANNLLNKLNFYYCEKREIGLANKAIIAMLDTVITELEKVQTALSVYCSLMNSA